MVSVSSNLWWATRFMAAGEIMIEDGCPFKGVSKGTPAPAGPAGGKGMPAPAGPACGKGMPAPAGPAAPNGGKGGMGGMDFAAKGQGGKDGAGRTKDFMTPLALLEGLFSRLSQRASSVSGTPSRAFVASMWLDSDRDVQQGGLEGGGPEIPDQK